MTERGRTSGPAEGTARLGRELQTLRRALSVSGTEFAQLIGWSQSRVSKIETGRKLCTEDELRRWLDVTHALQVDADRIHGLHARLQRAADGTRWSRDAPVEPASTDVSFSYDVDETASSLSGVHPQLLPLTVATSDYLASVVDKLPQLNLADGRFASWPAQLEQVRLTQQGALYRENTEVDLVLGEPALSNGPASAGTRVAQLDRIEELSGLPNVRIGIVPLTRLSDTPVPVAFTIRSPPSRVSLCGLTGEYRIDDADEVAVYEAVFETARSAAVYGDDAVDLLHRTSERIRAEQ